MTTRDDLAMDFYTECLREETERHSPFGEVARRAAARAYAYADALIAEATKTPRERELEERIVELRRELSNARNMAAFYEGRLDESQRRAVVVTPPTAGEEAK